MLSGVAGVAGVDPSVRGPASWEPFWGGGGVGWGWGVPLKSWFGGLGWCVVWG